MASKPILGSTTDERRLMTEEYEDIVRMCAEKSLPMDLSNRHIDHAAILFRNALRTAKKDMRIFTGKLPDVFINKIRVELVAALSRGLRVDVIVLDSRQSAEAEKIRKDYPELLAIRTISSDLFEGASKVPHFFVADSRMYRVEKSHDMDQDFERNPEVTATANFSHPVIAGRLTESFESLREFCVPVK